jgi:exodeoxyribonuclease V alpha subunit
MLANDTLEILSNWHKTGTIRAVDLAIAKFLHQRDPASDGRVLLAGALASYQYGKGHTCLDPKEFHKSPATFLETLSPRDTADEKPKLDPVPESWITKLNWDDWMAALIASPLVGKAESSAPLVLDGDRIYLTRNWDHEQRIGKEISARLEVDAESTSDMAETLGILFPDVVDETKEAKPQGPHWQKISAALASEGRLLILTGGPGTGKTYTVARILALLQKDQPLRILLAAPTGKAAARLSESIAEAITSIPAHLRKHAPGKAITIHQMLGASRHGRHYRHDADNPLQADVVVIDEASMIDIEMMAAILKALPSQTRLILVGDKDQLASVEAGSVLGDLCKNIESRGYTHQTCERIRTLSGETLEPVAANNTDPLAQRTVMLRYSKRFDDHSGIGILAHAINAGNFDEVLNILESTFKHKDIRSLTLKAPLTPSNFSELAVGDERTSSDSDNATCSGYGHYLRFLRDSRPSLEADDEQFITWSRLVLDAYSRYQILCAMKSGPFGVNRINELVEALLHKNNLIEPKGGWYEGRPVMMTRNDYELGIMNGDVGITLAFPNKERTGEVLKIAFRNDDGSMKFVLPSRLSEADTVYAMTVHKSQGSEFEHAVLLFPDAKENPIMTRELIYTGVTRARRQLTILCSDKRELAEGVKRQIRRSGRLHEILRLQK